MEFLAEYGMFLAKVVTFVIAFAVIAAIAIASAQRNTGKEKGQVKVTRLNDRFEQMCQTIKDVVCSDQELKQEQKNKKKELKEKQKSEKKAKKQDQEEQSKKVFVVDFEGDIKASATDELREAITAILTIAKASDEVVVRLESPGGVVHGYGLAASQLNRVTSKGIPLTVCVDKVAASGGYMMACVANKILAAPFAIIGSIGVVAQLPNFNRVLKKYDVDYDVYTAGEYKRTLTMFGENTEKGREKFMEDLQDTHELFKEFIAEHREQVDVANVATGEYWFATRAQEKSLVDDIMTSDEYLLNCANDADILHVEYEFKKSLQDKLGIAVSKAVEQSVSKVIAQLNNRFWAH